VSSRSLLTWRLPRSELVLGRRTLIMGIVNVTPDSFSDGGRFLSPRAAVDQGLRLLEQGADILDLGGESTRPGAEPVSAAEESARVLPVIRGILDRRPQAVVSIDTYKAAVAEAALEAGAQIVNDVTALRGDPDMAGLVARRGAGLILMHMRGEPRTMQKDPRYEDVVAEVSAFLRERARAAREAGVAREAIVVDPGIGFGKNLEHNLALMRHLGSLRALGYPVLLGASRKTCIGQLTGREQPRDRLWGTLGAHVVGAALGADVVRVHDVAPLKEALSVADAILAAGEED